MKLAKQSIPYRALQKVSGVVVLLFFLATANDWGFALAVGGSLAVIGAATAYEVAYYRRFDYELTADTLDISSGVISRREREIPYRRIQNVDVSRNVLQRALGIAAVDLETAGGSSTEGSIRYVVPSEATRLQREVQRRKSRASTTGDTDAHGDSVGPVEEDLFAISPGELALVGALSFDGRLIGLLAFLGSGSFPVLRSFLPGTSAAVLTATAIVAIGALFIVSWIIGAVVAFSNYYGFRLSRAGDELRYERGLFRRYSGSIPTEKVQTLTISDNPAKRALGYATMSIETAGYAPGQGGELGTQAAVPIASRERVYELARDVETFGDPEFSRPPKRIRWRYAFRYAMVVAALAAVAFAVDWWIAVDVPWYLVAGLLGAVPPAAHLKWKHRGYWLGEDHLLTRNGFWSRQVRVVPYYRIQNVIDSRTVFQRRWHVATVVADTAGTNSLVGSDAAAIDFDTAEAERLREELTERLQASLRERRTHYSGFEWLEDTDEATETDDAGDEATGPDDADDADSDPSESDDSDPESGTDDEHRGVVEPDIDPDDDGVVRPDFSPSERDYSEPAETIDDGDYAVDRYPSDSDVRHRTESTEEPDGRNTDGGDGDEPDIDGGDGDATAEGETDDDDGGR
ncbi:PH domain-containing protein [Halorubrum sp. DTA98]|uniref:PH domain-containing protein n=1 Tax=Halorubrum sp. DTA98 TaxID=3402163 RepID=UPI003AAD8773